MAFRSAGEVDKEGHRGVLLESFYLTQETHDGEAAADAMAHALGVLEPSLPSVAAKLRAAEADVLIYLTFPVDHWKSIASTDAIERVNAELDRRPQGGGASSLNTASLTRLFTAVLLDQHDEWQDGQRHFSQRSMARLLTDSLTGASAA